MYVIMILPKSLKATKTIKSGSLSDPKFVKNQFTKDDISLHGNLLSPFI